MREDKDDQAGRLTLRAAIAAAAERRHLCLRANRLRLFERGFPVDIGDDDHGPDLFCTLGSLWDVLGPGAPLYGVAMQRLQRVGRLFAEP